MTNMNPPTSRKQLQNFIGVINYNHNMWPRRAHMLAPLTRLTSIKWTFKWTQVEQDAFAKIKRIMARNNLLIYPDFHKTFKVCTDVSAV